MQRERQRFLVLEAYADLADYAESIGELSAARGVGAQRLIAPIVPHLPTVAAGGWDELLCAYFVCTNRHTL